jgi:hypothetical protein
MLGSTQGKRERSEEGGDAPAAGLLVSRPMKTGATAGTKAVCVDHSPSKMSCPTCWVKDCRRAMISMGVAGAAGAAGVGFGMGTGGAGAAVTMGRG